jgi:hypothetical protein
MRFSSAGDRCCAFTGIDASSATAVGRSCAAASGPAAAVEVEAIAGATTGGSDFGEQAVSWQRQI